MSSFQAKIGWKKPRKRENKNYCSVPFLPDWLEKIIKKQQKNLKIFKIRLWHHFKPKEVRKGREREKIKIIVPLRSYSTGYRKFQKNRKKIKKIPLWHRFKPKQGGNG